MKRQTFPKDLDASTRSDAPYEVLLEQTLPLIQCGPRCSSFGPGDETMPAHRRHKTYCFLLDPQQKKEGDFCSHGFTDYAKANDNDGDPFNLTGIGLPITRF